MPDKTARALPAARGTPEGEYFSVVSWKFKGDDLWLYHKASGNKKANLYELALVGEIEALRAERLPASAATTALSTPEGEIPLEELERLEYETTPGPFSAKGVARTLLEAQVRNVLSTKQAQKDGAFLALFRNNAKAIFARLASQARAIEALRAEHRRLIDEIATLRSQLAEARAQERERCAKVADAEAARWAKPNWQDRKATEEQRGAFSSIANVIAQRIRALSPAPDKEKPE